jgi:hypothetical protein
MRATVIDGAHSAQIDLHFGDFARELLSFRVDGRAGYLLRKRFHFLAAPKEVFAIWKEYTGNRLFDLIALV